MDEINTKKTLEDAGLTSTQQAGVTAGRGYANVPITSSAITPTPSLTVTPPTVVPVPDITGLAAAATAPVTPTTTPAKAPALADTLDTRITALRERLSGKDVETASRVNSATAQSEQQLNELNRMIGLQAAQTLADQEKALASGETVGFATGEAARVNRNNAVEALRLSALAESVRGNLALADRQARTAVDTEFAQIQKDLQTARANILKNYESFTPEEKKRADATLLSIDERDAFVAEQKKDRQTILGIAATAAANGLKDNLMLQKIANATTPIEATQIASASGFLTDPLARRKAELDLEKTSAEIRKINNEARGAGVPGITNPQAGEYAGALSVILGSAKFTKEQKADLVASINSGADPATVIKNKAKDIMGQTLATELDKAEKARAQVQSIKTLLDEYYAQGGKTNIFTGNFESAINKLGEVNDPKLVELAVNISSALQIYRNSVSGTAYSVQEGQEIASIFPGINNSKGLNEARIAGRLRAFDTTIDAAYENTLGKDAYAAVKGKGESQAVAGEVQPTTADDDYVKSLEIPGTTTPTTTISTTTTPPTPAAPTTPSYSFSGFSMFNPFGLFGKK
jgi:hypothetical protein